MSNHVKLSTLGVWVPPLSGIAVAVRRMGGPLRQPRTQRVLMSGQLVESPETC